MIPKYVVKNVPTKLPITSTVLYSFLLYYFNVDNIWWGIFITLYSIYWIVSVYAIIKQEGIDVFKKWEEEEGMNIIGIKSRFQQRMDDALKAREEAKSKKV